MQERADIARVEWEDGLTVIAKDHSLRIGAVIFAGVAILFRSANGEWYSEPIVELDFGRRRY